MSDYGKDPFPNDGTKEEKDAWVKRANKRGDDKEKDASLLSTPEEKEEKKKENDEWLESQNTKKEPKKTKFPNIMRGLSGRAIFDSDRKKEKGRFKQDKE